MTEITQKVRGNALIAYFMILINLAFLVSKNPDVSHPFVKHHVKSAFTLHLMLLGMFFIMSYPIFTAISFLGYTLNTLITILLALCIFASMLFGMMKAYHGKTVSFGDIFGAAGLSHAVIKKSESSQINEKDEPALILSHIPFFGYIIYPRHKSAPHIADIVKINFIITLTSSLTLLWGFVSLSSILMLGYIIWSVFNCSKIVISKELATPQLDFIPGMSDLHSIIGASINYMKNSLKKDSFSPFPKLLQEQKNKKVTQAQRDQIEVQTLKNSAISAIIFYIPFINLIGLFSLKSKQKFHAQNGIGITLISACILTLSSGKIGAVLLLIFPICFGIGYTFSPTYRMPFIHDIFSSIAGMLGSIKNFFSKTRKLQKTHTQKNIKIGEETHEKNNEA